MAKAFGAGRGVFTACLSVAVALGALVASSKEAEARRRHYGGFKPAYAAFVVDGKTGKVLHAENADSPRYPASVTKVMTLYLLFEQIEQGKMSLHTPLHVTAHAASMAPSKLGLRPGATISAEDAIRALVTKSANDAAATIAENIDEDEDAFAERMTRKARALGMKNTTFRNASGLPDPEQVTTARDLVTLGRAIQDRFPKYYRYFGTYSFAYRGVNHRNHNRLLGRVEGVDGIKTGYTNASGFNLLTSARRGERHLVASIMGGRTGGWRDARMKQMIDAYLPQAFAGARTAPVVAEATETQRKVVAVASVPVRGRGEAMRTAAPMPTPSPMAVAIIAASQVRGAGASGSAAQASASVPKPQPKPVIGAETTGTIAAGLAPGNPHPRPGVLGTLTVASKAETTGSIGQPRTLQMAAATESPQRKGEWSIQIGAFPSQKEAQDTLSEAKDSAAAALAKAEPYTEKVEKGSLTLVRARFAGFDKAAADGACKALKAADYDCMTVRN